jgi:protein-S-isoprenylcysteine O-methyltransferase Ste14
MIRLISPWWRGARGEWYVIIQIALFILIIFGPRSSSSLPAWTWLSTSSYHWIGGSLLVMGFSLIISGLYTLRKSITPLPYPRENARLIDYGPFRWVRHPIYSGGLCAAVGWAIWVQGWFTLGYAGVLCMFLDIKSRREEKWLSERFSEYRAYQTRVKKLLPWVY